MRDPQAEFDKTYITSTEICKTLQINRCTLLQARRKGQLPDPIQVNGSQMFIWLRSEAAPIVKAWQVKRGLAQA